MVYWAKKRSFFLTSNKLLSVSSLKKSFGGLQAVNVDSLEFSENEITSLIGPNGAGKTTLISIICGISSLTTGKIQVGGAQYHKIHAKNRFAVWQGGARKGAIPSKGELSGACHAGAKIGLGKT